MKSQIANRSEGIDALRFALTLIVLALAHINFWSVYAYGNSAVWEPVMSVGHGIIWLFQGHGELNPAVLCFIVLSGYCIHKNGLSHGVSITPFAIRRSLRIYPVYFVAVFFGIICFLIAYEINPTLAKAFTSTTEIAPSCVAAKLVGLPALYSGFFRCSFLGNGPLLTVTVEIMLYVSYAVAMLYCSRRFIVAVLATSIIVGQIIALRNTADPLLYAWWQNTSLYSFMPYWALGAFAVSPSNASRLRRGLPSLALMWLLATALTHIDPTAFTSEIRKLLLAGIFANLIIYADTAAMRANVFSWLGQTSYSIYALHAPLAVLVLVLGGGYYTAVSAAIIAGVGCYFALERPLTRLGKRLASVTSIPRAQTSFE